MRYLLAIAAVAAALGTTPAQAATTCAPYVGTAEAGVLVCVETHPVTSVGKTCVFVLDRTPVDPWHTVYACVPV